MYARAWVVLGLETWSWFPSVVPVVFRPTSLDAWQVAFWGASSFVVSSFGQRCPAYSVTWSGEGRRQSPRKRRSWCQSPRHRGSCSGSCTSLLKKGAPRKGGKEKATRAEKAEGVAKEKAAVGGRGGDGVVVAA